MKTPERSQDVRRAVSVLARSAIFRQTAIFTAASALGSVFSAVSIAVLARNVSVSQFGSFSFAVSFMTFIAMFFELGIFAAVARIAAQARSAERREIAGAALLLFLPIGVSFSLTVFGLAFVVDRLFNVHAAHALQLTAPLAFVYAFLPISTLIAQGIGRLHVYSVSAALSQMVFLGLLLLAFLQQARAGVALALLLRASAMLVGALLLAVWLRPLFAHVRNHVRRIFRETRSYGLQVFVGRVLGIGTYNMDVLMVGAWTNSSQVGLYSLAGAVTAAVGLPATGLSLALFPRFARQRALDKRWLISSAAIGVLGFFFLSVFGRPLLSLFFSSRYDGAAAFLVPLAAAQAIRGVTGIYNAFLASHGRGSDLRNAALVLTASNLVLNFALIPPFGALGAAWASLVALVANLCAHVIFYRRSAQMEALSAAGGEFLSQELR